jgi:hypothetical protein
MSDRGPCDVVFPLSGVLFRRRLPASRPRYQERKVLFNFWFLLTPPHPAGRRSHQSVSTADIRAAQPTQSTTRRPAFREFEHRASMIGHALCAWSELKFPHHCLLFHYISLGFDAAQDVSAAKGENVLC